ncbi:molybdopterin-binding protein [Desulfotomaculum sp. 1211_IL3151]|uniref:molybdopterin-binding protein n=1 Tax=Desulfotomaculum sp. 1211_IL3151 TaxID=3084055 RepID=UPI002FD960E7
MTIKKVKVEDAVGMVLGHELTKIVPGSYKGPAFRKGHIIREEDIPHLKDIGKEHIYLIEMGQGQLHENEAADRIARAVCGSNVEIAAPSEGRVNLKAKIPGLLKINRAAVAELNETENVALSTKHSDILVKPGDLVAAAKVVPLVIEENAVAEVEERAAKYKEIVRILPLAPLKVGTVITGNEVFYGRIEDKFAKVITAKALHYGAEPMGIVYRPDDSQAIRQAILEHIKKGADIVIAAGGMSVDPDDVTPEAIRATGADIVTYGSPVLPGAMFMLAYLGDTTLIGLPACGMFAKTTVFDLVFPRILAGDHLTRKDIAAWGYGGLCSSCPSCTYPHCPFGK